MSRKIPIRNQQKIGNSEMFNQQFKLRNIMHEEELWKFNNIKLLNSRKIELFVVYL